MSSVYLTAVAVFENPQKLEGIGKTILVDAQIYLGSGHTLVGSFQYFNHNDIPFKDDHVGMYFIHAAVSDNHMSVLC